MFLSINNLNGEIPAQLGNLSNLIDLRISHNQLRGHIPAELAGLSQLRVLSLEDNQLTGSVPTQFGELSALRWLYLDGNRLSGELPEALIRLSALEQFRFGGNAGLCAPADNAFREWLSGVQSSGDVCRPIHAGDRAALVAFYNATDGPNWTINTNWLSDEPLSRWHGAATDNGGRIIALRLRRNRLSGEVPSELGALTALRELDLTGNELNGSIPFQFGQLSNLERLLLSGNRLSGEAPHELTELFGLTEFQFGGNAGLCAPADDGFQRWLNRIPFRGGEVCPMDSMQTSARSPTTGAADAPAAAPAPTAAPTRTAAIEDSAGEDAGGGCSARRDGSFMAGAGDAALMALPLLGLMGLASRRRWRL